jgi:hypothetical protein
MQRILMNVPKTIHPKMETWANDRPHRSMSKMARKRTRMRLPAKVITVPMASGPKVNGRVDPAGDARGVPEETARAVSVVNVASGDHAPIVLVVSGQIVTRETGPSPRNRTKKSC